MKIWRYSILSVLTMLMGVNVAFSQSVSPEMLQQAAAMGYSEADIKAKLSSQQGGSTGSSSQNTSSRQLPTSTNGQVQRNNPLIDSTSPYSGRILTDTIEMLTMDEKLALYKMMLDREEEQKNRVVTFGQDFFRNDKVSFEPNINIPTPKDYILTAGDEVVITIWGDSELLYKEAISPDGVINVPNYGPVNISGMRADEAQKHLEERLSKVYNSLGKSSQLMLSVGQIGSIRVNVSGEVLNPGTYTVPAVANMFHLLHLSGGTTDIGDMRKIELYRESELVATLDLYDYIFNGNAAGNTLLKDGDVLVVKPYQVRVSATGEIKRPMYYQIGDGDRVEDLLSYVGGFNENAYKEEVKIYRNNGSDREIVMVDRDNFANMALIDGDSVLISRANNEYKNIVSIDGALWRGGDFQYDEKTNTLRALIEKAGGLRGNAFASRGVITRRNADYTTSMLNFVTVDVVNGVSDIDLKNYDKVYIPMIDSLREEYNIVITGEVNSPDTLEFHRGMSIEDAIIMAGGLKESASLATLDVTRRVNDKNSMEYSENIAETYNFQINENLSMNQSTADFALQPFDLVVIRKSPQYEPQKKIFIMGEVLFPGTYMLNKDNTYLSDVIAMAKGVKPNAYIKGTSLTRRSKSSNSDGEDVNNENYFTTDNITDLALKNLSTSTGGRDTLNVSISDVRTYSVGIDMEKALEKPYGPDDVLLQENDIILIPKFQNIVNIVGAVYYPNATSFTTRKLKHYIDASGGYNKAAIKRPFVVHPNGMVASTKTVFFVKRRPKVEPGCMIVIPEKTDRASMAEIISAVSSMASVASSISTLGVAIGSM